MSLSDSIFDRAQKFELEYAVRYTWSEEWKKLYKHHLRHFFGIGYKFPGCVVVEIGCGPIGIISIIEAKETIGLDPLMDEYIKMLGEEQGVYYINAKGEEVPLPDNYADIVFCSNVLNHVQEPEKVLSEIARIMKQKGILYFDVHDNLLSIGHPHRFKKGRLYNLLRKYFKIQKMIEVDKIPTIAFDYNSGVLTIRKYVSETKVWGSICSSLKS